VNKFCNTSPRKLYVKSECSIFKRCSKIMGVNVQAWLQANIEKRHPSSTCAERRGSGSCLGLQSAIDILEQLHWLPIEWRIKFKIACIT